MSEKTHKELTNYRRKMCQHCAFRKESLEVRSGYMNENLQESLVYGGVFLCHETMQQISGQTKWAAEFDQGKRPDGTPCNSLDHQLCAGYMAIYGTRHGIEPRKEIDINGHYLEEIFKDDWALEAEIEASEEKEKQG